MDAWPRLLADFRPLPGRIKGEYEDFLVEELPLYPADGVGTHTYFLVEKAGLSTIQAVHDLARVLGVKRHEIGFAGQKDARAVTRQWMSVEHVPPERVAAVTLPRITIREVTRHRNKLRLGHLRGNRFVIKVRETETHRCGELSEALQKLAERGVPNYFGTQRFGYRGDTWRIGQALVRGDWQAALDLILGRPTDEDHGDIRRARKLYDRGRFAAAARFWPVMFHTERRALKALAQTGGKRRAALRAIDRSTRDFYLAAYQSHLFNRVVAARLPDGLARLQLGDLAWRHANGAVFRVTAPEVEQPRADRFEISPSGPLFGYRMTEPEGAPAELEARVLAEEGLGPEAFHTGPLRVKGGRRPLRFPIADVGVELAADNAGPYLELRFVLPRGCYATAVLRELFTLDSAAAEASGDGGAENAAGRPAGRPADTSTD